MYSPVSIPSKRSTFKNHSCLGRDFRVVASTQSAAIVDRKFARGIVRLPAVLKRKASRVSYLTVFVRQAREHCGGTCSRITSCTSERIGGRTTEASRTACDSEPTYAGRMRQVGRDGSKPRRGWGPDGCTRTWLSNIFNHNSRRGQRLMCRAATPGCLIPVGRLGAAMELRIRDAKDEIALAQLGPP